MTSHPQGGVNVQSLFDHNSSLTMNLHNAIEYLLCTLHTGNFLCVGIKNAKTS